jgi:phosphoglycerate dehydrogenase-like enzyme
MMNILVNLPEGFFYHEAMQSIWHELDTLGTVTQASCNTADEIAPLLENVGALLMWSWPQLTPELLDKAPNLKFVGHIDASQNGARNLLERGIPVSISRRGFSPAVAEMALTLILASLRRTSNFHAAMWNGREEWVSSYPDDIDVDERQLTGRRVGIVGFGGIGQRLGQLLAPFECDIKIHDPFLPEPVAKQAGVEKISLDELMKHSEILVLCAAANEGTKHIITREHIEALAPKSVFVNVCRASLVDTEALLQRIRRDDLYVALDVFDQEPLDPNSPLRGSANVYLTPHRAGGLIESTQRIIQYLVDDLRAFQNGEPQRHALTAAIIPSLDK